MALKQAKNEITLIKKFMNTMVRPPIARNVDSRTRLLNSLGLFQEERQRHGIRYHGSSLVSNLDNRNGSVLNNGVTNDTGMNKPRHVRSLSDIPVRSALHNTVAFQTRLNDASIVRNSKENENMRWRRSSFLEKKKPRGTSSVRFNTVVSGVKIPSRNQYSRRIKQTLWRDRYELSEMVERNTAEFHAENYDWNQVVLDEEMYVDASSGEKVHPCHVEGFDDREEYDEDAYDDDSSDGPAFIPLSRSGSVSGENSSP